MTPPVPHEAVDGAQGRAFRRAFGAALTRYGRFGHEAHLFVAWQMLRAGPALSALADFRAGLRALAEKEGKLDKYHETLTVAWFLLVLDRLARPDGAGADWDTFLARNADLRDARVLDAHYPPDMLRSAGAREAFLPPLR